MKRQLSLFFRRCWTSLKVGILFWTGETPVFVIEAKHNVCLDSSTEPLFDRCLVKWTPSNRHVSLLHFKVGHCEPLLQYQTQRLLTHRASVTIGMEPVRRGHALVLQPCFQRLCMCWLKEKRAGSIRFGGPLAVAENRKKYKEKKQPTLSHTNNTKSFHCQGRRINIASLVGCVRRWRCKQSRCEPQESACRVCPHVCATFSRSARQGRRCSPLTICTTFCVAPFALGGGGCSAFLDVTLMRDRVVVGTERVIFFGIYRVKRRSNVCFNEAGVLCRPVRVGNLL